MHALIHHLTQRFALNEAQAERLWALSGLRRPPDALGATLFRGLAVLAALLLGAGLVFWVAANWQEQSRSVKLHLLQAAVLLPGAAALIWPRARTAALLLAMLALGGLLAFVGQTYQTGADAWQLFATWAVLALPWALAARRDGLWAAWLLIAGLGLALWAGDALLNPLGSVFALAGQHWITPLLWALLFMLPLALPGLGALPADEAASISWRLAALMALSAWCAHALWSLFARGMDDDPQMGPYLLCAALSVGAAALVWALRPRDYVVLALAVLTLNVLVIAFVIWLLMKSQATDIEAALLLLTVVAAVSVGGSGAWLYRLQRQDAQEDARKGGQA